MLSDEFNDYISKNLEQLNFKIPETKEYIKGIFREQLYYKNDLSGKILTFKYFEAKQKYNFENFRKIGDWLFWTKSIYPEFLSNASEDFYDNLAKTSYHKCYILLNKEWELYEELADRFEYFVNHICLE
mgnify:CR=1 FL=1